MNNVRLSTYPSMRIELLLVLAAGVTEGGVSGSSSALSARVSSRSSMISACEGAKESFQC